MDISETLQTLYTATVEQDDGTYQITVPDREIATGTLSEVKHTVLRSYRHRRRIPTPPTRLRSLSQLTTLVSNTNTTDRLSRKVNSETLKSRTSVTKVTGSRKLSTVTS